jgi:segregation and condensation protein A
VETETPENPADRPQPAPPGLGFAVTLPQFEGPLDLLLSLIQEHKLDILHIPISFITDRYLEYMEAARALNLDLAGEYLVMAATLAHIKSRMLLPPQDGLDAPEAEAGPDPREELIRRLLEYQKYRTAGQDLAALPQLGRDLFTRRAKEELPLATDDMSLLRPKDLTAYRLIEALSNVLARRKLTIPHEVFVERLSIGDRILAITDRLREQERIAFSSLFSDLGAHDRHRVVPTFLAVLEMTRLKLLKVHQAHPHGEIYLSRTEALSDTSPEGVELDYRG